MKTVHVQGRTGDRSARAARTALGAALAAAAALLLSAGAFGAQQPAPTEIDKKIEPWVIENTRAGAQAEYFVVLERQADLSAAAKLKGKLDKGKYVYRTLFRTAEESQRALRAELDARGVEYRSFYLVNALLVKGDRELARLLAARPDVRRIDGNPVMRQELPKPEPAKAL